MLRGFTSFCTSSWVSTAVFSIRNHLISKLPTKGSEFKSIPSLLNSRASWVVLGVDEGHVLSHEGLNDWGSNGVLVFEVCHLGRSLALPWCVQQKHTQYQGSMRAFVRRCIMHKTNKTNKTLKQQDPVLNQVSCCAPQHWSAAQAMQRPLSTEGNHAQKQPFLTKMETSQFHPKVRQKEVKQLIAYPINCRERLGLRQQLVTAVTASQTSCWHLWTGPQDADQLCQKRSPWRQFLQDKMWLPQHSVQWSKFVTKCNTGLGLPYWSLFIRPLLWGMLNPQSKVTLFFAWLSDVLWVLLRWLRKAVLPAAEVRWMKRGILGRKHFLRFCMEVPQLLGACSQIRWTQKLGLWNRIDNNIIGFQLLAIDSFKKVMSDEKLLKACCTKQPFNASNSDHFHICKVKQIAAIAIISVAHLLDPQLWADWMSLPTFGGMELLWMFIQSLLWQFWCKQLHWRLTDLKMIAAIGSLASSIPRSSKSQLHSPIPEAQGEPQFWCRRGAQPQHATEGFLGRTKILGISH